ncbi:glutamine--fructose-6-phosphate transaminase (isomerizing) [Thermosphaera aggregans]|jgi:glucosamine--fructose-6-phosphate aminotransferase (isomerizing)|uniref:glutamine--fructose-6-phosphate transaminase (isomerizing) n=1 Tax=Thermosphaera aggregans (strain DSM 11486 / M11TL) TaxID=633148 RepID=D5U2I5_THEAM|nr:glutamine--fructose-6-phosphate transaminase (isomerizing) [Thermosphaera aggregans]ADG91335.1 glutamine--fructose-6-phosphate transaminase [Thermosphaera aggregans DSM 11486]
MGGIFAAVCKEKIPEGVLYNGLRRLVYRGYDGAGVAFLRGDKIVVWKSPGHLEKIAPQLNYLNTDSDVAVAHTRYASRGWPVLENTHPLLDCTGRIAVVGDGIIENYEDYRKVLEDRHHQLKGRTDTEVAAHLLEEALAKGVNVLEVLQTLSKQLKGIYSLVFLIEPYRKLFFIANGQPLVIGIGEKCYFVSSDIPSLYGFAETAYMIEDGTIGWVDAQGFTAIRTADGSVLTPERLQGKRVKYFAEAGEKGGFPHFMLKEIYESPEALNRVLLAVMEKYLHLASMIVYGAKNAFILANGTSLHAGMIGSYYFNDLAGVSVDPVSAAEFPYYALETVETGTVVIAISQSGETSDVISSIKLAKQRGAVVIGITNNVGSRLALESNVYLPIGAGPEIAVPATKSFTATLATLLLFASYTGMFTGKTSRDDYRRIVEEIKNASALLKEKIPEFDKNAMNIVQLNYNWGGAYVASSGINYPLALEGALKLKEAAIIHAEGFQLGEMRHGPMVLVSRDFPMVLIEPAEEQAKPLYVKVLEEARNKGAKPIVIGPGRLGDSVTIQTPSVPRYLSPIVSSIPIQLLAYRLGVAFNRPIDTPPGLAKAITT